MAVDYTVISIGTLSHNRLWGESVAVRTAHATCTLVTLDKRLILVDPSLPEPVLAARLNERTGKRLQDVTDVFCTTLRPVHRRGIEALAHAPWWTGEVEIQMHERYLRELSASAGRLGSDAQADVERDLRIVGRFKPAPDKFGPQVDLYPLLGPSPGGAGLLLTPATMSVLIAGDAALTAEHVHRGQVWEGCYDTEAAMESLRDIVELADVVVPGHDNVMLLPSGLRL